MKIIAVLICWFCGWFCGWIGGVELFTPAAGVLAFCTIVFSAVTGYVIGEL